MQMKLYYYPVSTFARRVCIALLEKHIDCEWVQVDLPAQAHKAASYVALNPYSKVPTLEDDGFVLYESSAILQYLEATHPTPALVPADARGRATVDMHMRLCDAHLGRHAGAILFPKRFLPLERWDLAAMDAAKGEISKHLAIVEQQLGGRPYLVGDSFTLADVAYLPFLQFLSLMDVSVGPRVTAWAARVLARPSAVATVPAR
jgi:glutathione S-transferase